MHAVLVTVAAEVSFLRALPTFPLAEKRARPSLKSTGGSPHVAGALPQVRHRDRVTGSPE